jgi:hypothetical protein
MEDFFKKLSKPKAAVPLESFFAPAPAPVPVAAPAVRAPSGALVFEVDAASRELVPVAKAPRRRSAHQSSLFAGNESLAFAVVAEECKDTSSSAVAVEFDPLPFTRLLPFTPRVSLSKWDLVLWSEACQPARWDLLSTFVVDHVTRMETGDRGVAARPDESTSKVMASLESSVTQWKAGKGRPHCLVGGVNTGKTTMLKLLAAKHNFEFVPIHEDATDELKEVLQFAGDKGLDTRPRLWVIEHLDMFDAPCKKLLRAALPRLQRSGPVFLTAWPSIDMRTLQSFTLSNVLSWAFPARLAFLDRFGPEEFPWSESFADAGGDLGRSMAHGQFTRGKAGPRVSTTLCGSASCAGGCSLCMARRRVPSNARLLVEDTLCPRSSDTKRAMLSESDVDLHSMLLQEMIPQAASSLESMLIALDALSFMDTATDFSTMVKDAFVSGVVQNVCASNSVSFSSGSTFPIPKCFFGKHRATPAALSDMERRVLVARGIPHPRLRRRIGLSASDADDESSLGDDVDAAPAPSGKGKKRGRSSPPKGKASKTSLVTLENDVEATDETEIAWDSPQCDTREFGLEVSLFEQAAGRGRAAIKA